ncbi:hypothetical protein IJ732_06545, partial [bacterium]|nr:hypothetical protein [bacterium]
TIPTLMQNSQNKELVSHYLKMNNILSNALKNTEATEQTKFYKLSETDFKSKFESHLKTTGCDANAGDTNFTPNVCLADGSQFAYGTFDESCTDNICDTLTIDTNGKKGPNTAGKDRFTINLTPNGLKALGESDTCSTGYDCGAYILAHHKLFDGETGSTTPTVKTNANLIADCKSAGASSCTIGNDIELTKVTTPEGDLYVSPNLGESTFDNIECPDGTELPSLNDMVNINSNKGNYNAPTASPIWTSTGDEYNSSLQKAYSFYWGSSFTRDKTDSLIVVCVAK